MAVNFVARRLPATPLLVLLIALSMTAEGVYWRYREINAAADKAVRSAEGHFNDVVSDRERQIHDGQREIEVVLLGATIPGLDLIEADDLSSRLEWLGSEELVGVRGFVLVGGDAEATVIADLGAGIAAPMLGPLVDLVASMSLSAGRPQADTMSVGAQDFVVVAVSASSGGSLLAVFDADEFILGASDHQGHFVMAQLSGSITTNSSSPEMLSMTDNLDEMSMGDTSVGTVDTGHEHANEVMHEHFGKARFASMSDVDVYGETWTLAVASMDGFIDIPASREVQVVATLGIALSVVLFGLVRRLSRSRLAAEHELQFNAERFDTGFERSPIGVAELDQSGALVKVNDALATLLGRSTGQLIGMTLNDFLADDDRTESVGHLTRLESGASERSRPDVKYELDVGRQLWVHQSASAVNGPNGARHTLVQMVDVTEQHRARDELQRQALHDALTGLPNRALLDDRLKQALARGRRHELDTVALFIDLDRFKQINDSLGHTFGDQMLVEVARRLIECARSSDTVARFGGDEFVVLCEDLDTPAEALQLAERIRSAMSTPVELDGRALLMTVSIGIAVASGDDDAEALLRDADLAMYQAKDNGRDRAVLFDHEMRESLVKRLALESELRHAIGNNELRVFYQPLYDLSTDRVLSFEALVRWEHPTRGLMTPDDFLPIADQLGLTPDIDAWILRTATAQLVSWSDELVDAEQWGVAVNASAPNFADPLYPDTVRAILDDTGLDPTRVTVEVTEHAVLANAKIANKVIEDLRTSGIKVAIDDFGTGYSSFSQVASLVFDVLKIDQSLIQKLGEDSGAEVIRTIIQMAHSLGLTTVAEGIESADDLQHLRRLGSDVAQGYFIAKPLPPDAIPAELARRHQALQSAAHRQT